MPLGCGGCTISLFSDFRFAILLGRCAGAGAARRRAADLLAPLVDLKSPNGRGLERRNKLFVEENLYVGFSTDLRAFDLASRGVNGGPRMCACGECRR